MCLKEGSEFAKHLAEKIPKARFVAVNHLEAHLLVAKLTNEELKFPFLGCILSGGHTILVQASGIGKYKVIASTVDDAIGEAFDKIAVLLDLDVLPNESYGAAVERYASMGMPGKFQFPVPLRLNSPKDESNRSRFSFSGLKTAVRRVIDTFASGEITVQDKADMCYAFQMAACLHVEDRIKYFYQNCKENNHKWQDFTRFKHLVVCGGTAVNETIRRRLSNLAESLKLQMVVPPPKYCTDNAVMIAYTGLIKSSIGHSDPVHTAFAHRWPLE
jgi:N6-L-threonylcarbamoyladenine synthase